MKRREMMMSGLAVLASGAVALAAGEKETPVAENGKAKENAVKLVGADVSPETIASVKAVLQEHDKALSNHDLAGVLSTYHNGPQTVLMGTGPGELWGGLDEIGDAYKHFFEGFDKGTQEFKYGYANGMAKGDVAWLSTAGDVTGRKGEEKKNFAINVSAVLAKNDGKWQFSHMHFSNLTGPEKPEQKA